MSDEDPWKNWYQSKGGPGSEPTQDVSFSSGRVYVPKGGTGLPLLPPPGAVLLDASDISATSGLVPGALERALSRRSSP